MICWMGLVSGFSQRISYTSPKTGISLYLPSLPCSNSVPAVFLDEVWQLIGASSNELAAEYVLEIFKIIRGYGG